MPRLTEAHPKYRKKTVAGHVYAYVTIAGKEHSLGPWKTAASLAEYNRLIGEWLANNRQAPPAGPADLTIAELIAAFWDHAKVYYVSETGHLGELSSYKLALRPVKRLYGHTLAAKFGPLAMKFVREEMVKAGWARPFTS